jgi:hypothetical protein
LRKNNNLPKACCNAKIGNGGSLYGAKYAFAKFEADFAN